MVQIKICGNHHPEDIHVLDPFQASIDFVGFIFTTQSKRWVNPEKVKRWLEKHQWLKPKAVAVFLNQSLSEISDVINMTSMTVIQLHGNESPSFCEELLDRHPQLKLWKTISVPANEQRRGDGEELHERMVPYLPLVDTILLDTKLPDRVGGTGQTFDWSVIPSVYHRISKYNQNSGGHVKLFVAGGLSAQNVGQLLAQNPLDGIDLASGAEIEGLKNKERIEALLNEVNKHGNR